MTRSHPPLSEQRNLKIAETPTRDAADRPSPPTSLRSAATLFAVFVLAACAPQPAYDHALVARSLAASFLAKPMPGSIGMRIGYGNECNAVNVELPEHKFIIPINDMLEGDALTVYPLDAKGSPLGEDVFFMVEGRENVALVRDAWRINSCSNPFSGPEALFMEAFFCGPTFDKPEKACAAPYSSKANSPFQIRKQGEGA